MLEMRPKCELCDRDLPADQNGALICSMECTFCDRCKNLETPCPNCGGQLIYRPSRIGAVLEKYPASSKRVLKSS